MKKHILISRITVAALFILLPLLFVIITTAAESKNNEELVPTIQTEFIFTEDRDTLNELIQDCIARKDAAFNIIINARVLGYEENHPVIILAKDEWNNAYNSQFRYEEILKELDISFWNDRLNKYPIATEIWLYLKNLGYNDYVCAGIMGNIMAESGRDSFDIEPSAYSASDRFYGICQWTNQYYAEIHGASLEEQCDFLRDTIKKEIDMFGKAYKSGFKYSDFIELEDERTAALVFAKAYERCSADAYSIRQKNAELAYKYFAY